MQETFHLLSFQIDQKIRSVVAIPLKTNKTVPRPRKSGQKPNNIITPLSEGPIFPEGKRLRHLIWISLTRFLALSPNSNPNGPDGPAGDDFAFDLLRTKAHSLDLVQNLSHFLLLLEQLEAKIHQDCESRFGPKALQKGTIFPFSFPLRNTSTRKARGNWPDRWVPVQK